MERGLISVDRWSAGSQAYFLTHLHADHTQGLSSAWSSGPLFCSRLTAKLLPFKFPDFNLSLLRVLEVGAWHPLSLTSPSSGARTTVQVMPIDAQHCPGSVMFLFRGEFGCFLYTGDFRWEGSSKRANKSKIMLMDALRDSEVKVLYLDNTYCHPSYAFPSRADAAEQVVDIIVSHPEHDVIIAVDNLGKEDLLVYVSRKLKIKVWVWPERLQTLHCLGYPDIFTTNTSLTRVRAVPRYSFSVDTLEGLNKMHPTLGIMPSGLPGVLRPSRWNDSTSPTGSSSIEFKSNAVATTNNERSSNVRSVERLHEYIYSVPYSDHASYSEIQEFVELVQPINMRGIVSSSSCYIDPLYYFGHFRGANQPSQKLWQRQHEGFESMSASRTKFKVQISKSLKSERKGQRSAGTRILGSRISRVNALRQVQRGTKIVESDCVN